MKLHADFPTYSWENTVASCANTLFLFTVQLSRSPSLHTEAFYVYITPQYHLIKGGRSAIKY
jgi:hypothetical protein